MTEKHTIEGWGARLNAPGEQLDISQAMLLSLGHLNSRLEGVGAALIDIQCRLTRIELYLQETFPDYERITKRAALLMLEGTNRSVPFDFGSLVNEPGTT